MLQSVTQMDMDTRRSLRSLSAWRNGMERPVGDAEGLGFWFVEILGNKKEGVKNARKNWKKN